jgi:hypothetical protein
MDRKDSTSDASTQGKAGDSSAGKTGAGFGNAGNTSGAQGYGAGTTANVGQGFPAGGSGSPGAAGRTDQGLGDRARDFAGSAQDKLADLGSTVRDRAGHLKNSLADALDTGADKLHQHGHSPTGGRLASAMESGGTAAEGDGRLGQLSDRVAGGMHSTAGWLRETDLDGLKQTIEHQVKEHPGRSLLIAAGLGYIIGKAIRK